MRWYMRLTIILLLFGPAGVSGLTVAAADTADAPSLVISQLKITSSSGQFVTLYNATDQTLDMSKYQLAYFNHYDLSKATSSKLVSLTGLVPPHSYFLINDSSLQLCYQLTVDSVSLGFSSTAGLVEVLALNQTNPGLPATPGLQDYVGWSKAAAAGAQTLPGSPVAFLDRQPLDTQHNPAVAVPGGGTWLAVQPDSTQACNMVSLTTPGSIVPAGLSTLLPAVAPPVTIIAADNSGTVSSIPAADNGLMAPRITELLPNPVGSGNDATNEFIELYNPNSGGFDLSGFSLQTGTTNLHSFTFPAGTALVPADFAAFYSSYTGLSLSNSGGQARLLAPNGTVISSTPAYGTAADGQAWALGDGNWTWTSKVTPGAANVIVVPPVKQAAKVAGTKSTAAKTKAKTAAKTTAAGGKAKLSAASTADNGPAGASTGLSPIHPWVLALVASLALLYGAYEYRADLANRFHRLRHYRRNRRARRLETARR